MRSAAERWAAVRRAAGRPPGRFPGMDLNHRSQAVPELRPKYLAAMCDIADTVARSKTGRGAVMFIREATNSAYRRRI
jgi:hypothetical protein